VKRSRLPWPAPFSFFLALALFGCSEPAAPPKPSPTPAFVIEEPPTEEEEAILELQRLAKPTIDLLVWSRDPRSTESDALLVLPPLAPDQEVVVRPGPGCELISVNDTRVAAETTRFASPPMRAGLNWLRVRTTLPRKVLGSVDVPPDVPRARMPRGDATEDEQLFYERLRSVLYPARNAGGSDEAAARAGLAALPDTPGGVGKEFGTAWVELAVALFREGHGTAMMAFGSGGGGATIWENPEVLAASRAFMDRLQRLIERHPRRWYLWLGVAWQLRWGEAWDGARTAFVHAASLDPRCGWTWFEIARWERKLEMDGVEKRDPRTRVALARASLKHFKIAKRLLAGRTTEGLPAVREHIDGAIQVLEKLVKKAEAAR
jgi:hypothetical protein